MSVLGRGLDALLKRSEEETIPTVPQAVEPPTPVQAPPKPPEPAHRERPKESVYWIEIEQIQPNPEQPRAHFDEDKIRELADSIKVYGILQPIVVSKREIDVPNGTRVEYQIVAGERRYRAVKLLGLTQIPAIIRKDEPDKLKLELALIENLQREDLNPIEKARAYKRLMEEFNLQVKDVGIRVGKSREAVANTMRLMQLPEYMQEAVIDGRLSEGQVRPLISLAGNPDEQHALFTRIITYTLSARDAEREFREVAEKLGMPKPRQAKRAKQELITSEAHALELQLAGALGTRVLVQPMRGGKGRISIEFFSPEELHAIAGKLAQVKGDVSSSTQPEQRYQLQQEQEVGDLPFSV